MAVVMDNMHGHAVADPGGGGGGVATPPFRPVMNIH